MQIIKDILCGAECLDLYLPEQERFDLFVYFHGGLTPMDIDGFYFFNVFNRNFE